MAERGGYRKPNNPAPVSGPGKMSQRTDGLPSEDNVKQAKRYISGGDYGEGKELMDIQGGAPMAAAPSIPTAPTTPSVPPIPREEVPSFFAPSAKPAEPITSGIAEGPGVGPEAMPMMPENLPSAEDRQRAQAVYALVARAAQSPGASQATRELARKIRGYIL